jgi:hypothetical protein
VVTQTLTVIKIDIMKKAYTIFNLLFLLLYLSSQSQTLGFRESECGITPNSSYYCYNFQYGHSGGYTLYHNGKIIDANSNDMGGYFGEYLEFVDDTTGFFVVFEAGGYYFTYKIINDSVFCIGTSFGYGSYLYIVSRHTVYLSSDSKELLINRFSDLHSQKNLVTDSEPSSDTIVFDTVSGIPFCQGLSEINYYFKTSNDTFVCTIKFKVDTLSSIKAMKKNDFLIFPNPTMNLIYIKPVSNQGHYSIMIFNNLGLIKKSIKIDDPGEKTIYIDDLQAGFYFVVFTYNNTKEVYKLIKI